jgi:hypothetical protein
MIKLERLPFSTMSTQIMVQNDVDLNSPFGKIMIKLEHFILILCLPK